MNFILSHVSILGKRSGRHCGAFEKVIYYLRLIRHLCRNVLLTHKAWRETHGREEQIVNVKSGYTCFTPALALYIETP
ncbi:MAG: hypothetical protein ABIO55_04950 [Ginsengibacter sp.]